MLPGAEKGIEFLFKPDFTAINGDVFLAALGQAFYSLSIAMGCICTYASYFSKQTNLTKSAIQISVIDSFVAILAGLMIFPAAFSVGVNPDSGPSLIFITLPNVFQQAFAHMPAVGYVISLLFFLLLSLAALTSLMSLHEVSTAFFQEELVITRKKAALLVTVSTCIIGAFCSLSLGAVDCFSYCSLSSSCRRACCLEQSRVWNSCCCPISRRSPTACCSKPSARLSSRCRLARPASVLTPATSVVRPTWYARPCR